MKKITFLLSSLLMISAANAQIFSDNFDALNNGDYIGPSSVYWSTWSGAVGGAEDAQATTAQASSAPNSAYLSSTAASGGPQDFMLDFGQQFTDGVFTLESKFYIDAGKNAYFNIQGTTTPGGIYTINCNMDGGSITIDDASANVSYGSYTEATWFTFRIEANLTTGRWQAFIDGNCMGVWNMPGASAAGVDFYPIQNSSYYIDDVMFDHVAYTPSALNATVAGFDIGGVIAGLNVSPTVTVANSGTTAITSFDVTVDYNGTPYVENVTGANITAGNSMDVVYSTSFPLVTGSMIATATITNINGGVDGDVSDNDACAQVNPVQPAAGKMVVGEEGTGTWCGWCPRGTIAMDKFANEYNGYWAGIAVHNGDPMVVTEYDAGFGTLITGYPTALVDRGAAIDPGSMSNDFFTRLQVTPDALITNGATWDPTTRELKVSVSANFQTNGTNGYKMICVLTEDGVSGTTSAYSQANYYSGGSNGVMGGFEILSNPVPAATISYNHVARAISPSFDGNNACFPATFNSGEIITQNYVWTLPATWDETKIHIVGFMRTPAGLVDNADMTTIDEAVTNGFVTACVAGVGEIQDFNVDDVLNIYPNPASTSTTIAITLKQDAEVQLTLIDVTGAVIATDQYGVIGSSTIDMNTSALKAGVYFVELTVNGQKTMKRLIIE